MVQLRRRRNVLSSDTRSVKWEFDNACWLAMDSRHWMGIALQVFAACLLLWSEALQSPGVNCQGWWETVVENAGISTMHAAVTHRGNVVLLDRTNIGDSLLPLPPGVCRNNPDDRVNLVLTDTPEQLVPSLDSKRRKSRDKCCTC